MSLEKLAKVLYVDEVALMHGPKGVAVHVRIEKSWHSATIDNEDLGERRLEVIAEHLAHLADAHVHKVRDSMHKGYSAANEAATRAALQADSYAESRRRWEADPFGEMAQQQQVYRRLEPTPYQPPPELPPFEPAVSQPMPSRFHAILAELKDL